MISGRVRYRRQCLCRAQSRAARWAVNGQTAVSAPHAGSELRRARSRRQCPGHARLCCKLGRARHGRQCPCRVLPCTGLGLAQRRRQCLRRAIPRAPGSASRTADGVVCAARIPELRLVPAPAASLAARDMDGSVHVACYRAPGSASRSADGSVCAAQIPEHRARPRAAQTA